MDAIFAATDISGMTAAVSPIGQHLRRWRERRRMSQLDLALEAEISSRHLSFVETGRSRPSRAMVLRLAERRDVPLREQNTLLVAAGFAPGFPERNLSDAALASARHAVDLVLSGHAPNPALAVDRHWSLISANRAAETVMRGVVDTSLLRPPVNVLRVSLHPAGLAPRIVNLGEWRAHILGRLRRQIHATGDPVIVALREELAGYPARGPTSDRGTDAEVSSVAVPFRIRVGDDVLDFITTTTVFGTPIDITLSELAIESFFPADSTTAAALRRMADRER